MRLIYRCFGHVALLVRYRRVRIDGDAVTVECDVEDGARLVLYSERDKVRRDYMLMGGSVSVPVKAFDGGVSVCFEAADGGVLAYGTPIEILAVGGERYLVGGAFGTEEELERIYDALVYVGELAREARAVADEMRAVMKVVESLKKRADSGDIINF